MKYETSNRCPSCGSRDLIVSHCYQAEWEVTFEITCTCNGGSKEQQQKKVVHHQVFSTKTGRINSDLEIEWEKKSRCDTTREEIAADTGLLPMHCSCWHGPAMQGEPAVKSRQDIWKIECGDCTAEPAFRWAGAGRTGKILIAGE